MRSFRRNPPAVRREQFIADAEVFVRVAGGPSIRVPVDLVPYVFIPGDMLRIELDLELGAVES